MAGAGPGGAAGGRLAGSGPAPGPRPAEYVWRTLERGCIQTSDRVQEEPARKPARKAAVMLTYRQLTLWPEGAERPRRGGGGGHACLSRAPRERVPPPPLSVTVAGVCDVCRERHQPFKHQLSFSDLEGPVPARHDQTPDRDAERRRDDGLNASVERLVGRTRDRASPGE